MTSMIYPDAFTIGYNYASGVDTAISRLTSMTNSSTTLEALSYLGLGTVVARTHAQSGVDLTYIGTGPGEGGDQYVGLDRFGRIIDQRWKTASTDKDRYLYGYDRNSNRLYRTNELSHSFDELYHADGASAGYDGLNQLSEFQRGTLSDTNSDSIPDTVASAGRYQTWDPDALGNFEGVNTDGTNQSRTHNKQNQSTVVGGNNLVFDNNGNTTTDETGRTLGWDAWNRLVKVNGTTRYANDALGRRIKEGSIDLYHSTNWQVVEERSGATSVSRNIWSPVYVDAMVLRDRDNDKNEGMEERLYVAQDANFNVTALINTSGTVVERYVQDPYGRFDVKDASWGVRASSSYAWVYLHQGGRWDATAALFTFRYRDYSPSLMRWVSVDPIGFRARDVNLYRYEENAPTVHLDWTGLDFSAAPVDSVGNVPPSSTESSCRAKFLLACRNNNVKEETCVAILKAVDEAHVPGWQWDKCQKWTGDCIRRLPPRDPTDQIIGAPKGCRACEVAWIYDRCVSNLYCVWVDSHFGIKVTLPDGSTFYFDNGNWGGSGRCFRDCDIPSYAR